MRLDRLQFNAPEEEKKNSLSSWRNHLHNTLHNIKQQPILDTPQSQQLGKSVIEEEIVMDKKTISKLQKYQSQQTSLKNKERILATITVMGWTLRWTFRHSHKIFSSARIIIMQLCHMQHNLSTDAIFNVGD